MALLPPTAARIPYIRTHHGDTVIDHYEWLRQKDDPAVVAHLDDCPRCRKHLKGPMRTG